MVRTERFLCTSGFSFDQPCHQVLLPLRGGLALGGGRRAGWGQAVLVPASRGAALHPTGVLEVFRALFSAECLEQLAVGDWDQCLFDPFAMDRITAVALPADRRTELEPVFGTAVRETGDPARVRLKLLEILMLVSGPGRPEEARPRTLRLEELIRYVEEHYAQAFTLAELAGLSGLSPSGLSRAFRQQVGTPLFEHINNIRVRKACLLLKRTEAGVLEIAYSVGYNNVSFFNRCFRRLMGMSPRQYRARVRR